MYDDLELIADRNVAASIARTSVQRLPVQRSFASLTTSSVYGLSGPVRGPQS